MIEKKTELLSFVTINLVIAGILKAYIFYKQFNINILPFLELDEILINCFDALLFYAIVGLFTTIVIYISCHHLLIPDAPFHNMKLQERYVAYRLFSKWKVSAFLFFILCAITFNFVRPHPNSTDLLYWIGAIALCIYFVPVAFCECNRKIQGHVVSSLPVTSVFFSCFLLLVCTTLIAYNDAYKVRDGRYYDGSYMEIKGDKDTYKKVVSSKTYYFIGLTKSHLFFYDSGRNSTDVYPRSQVRLISVR